MNAAELVFRHIHERSSEVALLPPSGRASTFSDLGGLAGRTKRLLGRLGIRQGDAVLLFETLNPILYGSILGMVSMGVTVVLVEPWMPAARINHILPLADPKLFFTNLLGKAWGMRVAAVRSIPKRVLSSAILKERPLETEAISVPADTPAILTFTSGTTGSPKGVVRTHGYLIDQHRVLTTSLDRDRYEGPDLCIFPNLVLSNLADGRASILVPPRWKPGDLRRIDALPPAYQPVSLTCGPGFLLKLMTHARLPGLKSFHVGGALVDCSIFERAFTRWPEARWMHLYGSTEAEPVAMMDAAEAVRASRDRGFFQTLCLGTPVPEIDARFESDTVWVTGPHVCPAYLGSEEENLLIKKRDDRGRVWHRMGDRIQVMDGRWWYAGREDQNLKEFFFEQELYSLISSSAAFVETGKDGHMQVFCQKAGERRSLIRKAWPDIQSVTNVRIRRDRRHRSRIDRSSRHRGISMESSRWLIYLRERFPLPAHLPVVGGIAFSGAFLGSRELLSPAFWGSFAGILLFFALLRLMDEVKDYEKDKIAHPDRPLPRGLLSRREVSRVIDLMTWAMLAYGALLAVILSPVGGLTFLILTAYLRLMYREFYVGKWLERRPVLYALSHQASLVPACSFPVFLASQGWASLPDAIALSLLILGSFFGYEVSRKLDPQAHPVLRTYRSLYGAGGCFALVLGASCVSAFAAWSLGLHALTWPFLLLLLLSYALLGRGKHKPVEAAAVLSLTVHVWAVALIPIKEYFQ